MRTRRKRGSALTEVTAADDQTTGVGRIELDVTGMSCGACARRVQNALNKLDGVHASVDFATRIATVDTEADIAIADLCAVVEQAGCHAEQRPAGAPSPDVPRAGRLRRRLMALMGH